MSYYAFYHVLIQKDNKFVNYEELPKDLVKLLNEATADIAIDDDEYSFDGLHDTHDSDMDEKFLEISRLFPDYTYVIREFPQELDEVSYDYYCKGRHFQISMDIPTPNISAADFS